MAGPLTGRTLADLASQYPREILGSAASGTRFPLLIKLLDCADWLSVQVHPDDAQADRLEGAGACGKTEAWHILAAEPDARLIAGTSAGITGQELRRAILEGRLMEHVVHHEVHAGDTFFIPAGTAHALGPGLLLYEVQQNSDTTFRIYDWDRPADAGRELHLQQSAEVCLPSSVQPFIHGEPAHPGAQELLRCDHFILERLFSDGSAAVDRDTGSQSFHALTVVRGEGVLQANGEAYPLGLYQSVLVPAALGTYSFTGNFEVLCSRLPGSA